MSVSTIPIRLPVRATAVARLAVRLDFPVPPRYEWVDTICRMGDSESPVFRVVRSLRERPASAVPDWSGAVARQSLAAKAPLAERADHPIPSAGSAGASS